MTKPLTKEEQAALDAQIALEFKQIEDAKKIPIAHLLGGNLGRCSYCGQVSSDLIYTDSLHGHDRYKCMERCYAR